MRSASRRDSSVRPPPCWSAPGPKRARHATPGSSRAPTPWGATWSWGPGVPRRRPGTARCGSRSTSGCWPIPAPCSTPCGPAGTPESAWCSSWPSTSSPPERSPRARRCGSWRSPRCRTTRSSTIWSGPTPSTAGRRATPAGRGPSGPSPSARPAPEGWPATSCSLTAARRGATAARCATPTTSAPELGAAVLHRFGLEHGSLAPLGANAAAGTAAVLAPDQLAAVTHPGGAARIIAPAGSGKTRVLTERARHLLDGWRLPAGAVCLVAFNKRAAGGDGRAHRRPARAAGAHAQRARRSPSSTATRRSRRSRRPPRAIDERERAPRCSTAWSRFPAPGATPTRSPPWLDALRSARLGLRDPAEVEADVRRRRRRLRRGLRRATAPRSPAAPPLDFDEQIVGAIELLLADPTTRARGAARLPAAAGRRVPGPHARPPAAGPPARRARPARSSAWATTTRRSTATPAPTRTG